MPRGAALCPMQIIKSRSRPATRAQHRDVHEGQGEGGTAGRGGDAQVYDEPHTVGQRLTRMTPKPDIWESDQPPQTDEDRKRSHMLLFKDAQPISSTISHCIPFQKKRALLPGNGTLTTDYDE